MNEALSVYGIYSGMAMPFIMFPATITMAISTMLLPAVSKEHSSGNKKQIKKLIRRTSYLETSVQVFSSTTNLPEDTLP